VGANCLNIEMEHLKGYSWELRTKEVIYPFSQRLQAKELWSIYNGESEDELEMKEPGRRLPSLDL
jgi:hypothetical protein